VRSTFHLAPADVWARRDPNVPITPSSLETEGFIHCTDGVEAMIATANRHYRADPRAFVVLTVDLDATGSPWQFDDPEQRYPHVYGPIDPAAVLATAPIARAADGTFIGFGASGIPEGIAVERIFIVEADYGRDAERLRPSFRPEHLTRIGRLMRDGIVLEAGGYLDLSTALMLVRASTEAEALDLFRDDIYTTSGVWTALRVRPFGRVVAGGRS
jgi:uncharacterized protein (DUF952 family)/uncharacterized protein YciI